MPRIFIVKDKTDFDALAGSLLDARVRDAQKAEATASLRSANPHVAAKLAPGTVILVPDAPGLKASAGEPAQDAPLAALDSLVAQSLETTAKRSRARLERRKAANAEISTALKSAKFRKAASDSKTPLAPFQAAAKALSEQDSQDAKAAEQVSAIGAAALAALKQLRGL